MLFSAGQDSTTCLAWALRRFDHVETVGFAYGQRHAVEMARRAPVREGVASLAPEMAARLGPDHVVALDALGAMSQTALTRDIAIEEGGAGDGAEEGPPNTFVPGRNLIFLAHAAALADGRDLGRLVTGVCEVDGSDYPDCRDDAMKAMQVALNLGMGAQFVIETPLIRRDKAAIWALAHELGGPALIDLIVEETHSCYLGVREARHNWGYGCGTCPACRLRARGWARWREEA